MMEHLPLVVKNTIHNKRRTTLTLLSLAASLCLLGTLMALCRSFFYSEAPEIMAAEVAFALAIGTLGGLIPADSATRKEILTALRQI